MEQRAVPVRDGGNLDERMEDADLVVRRHGADEKRAVGDGRTQTLEIEPAVAIDIQIRHAESLALERTAGIENGAMLRTDRNDVPAAVRRRGRRDL